MRKETANRELEERVKSMTQKLDSLVHFLEEERSQRKKIEHELTLKENKINELQIESMKTNEDKSKNSIDV